MSTSGDSPPPSPSQALLQESKAEERRLAIKETVETPSAADEKKLESQRLRERLTTLCSTFVTISADRTTIDDRVESAAPYEEVSEGFDPGAAYSRESALLKNDARAIIVEISEITRSIRSIEKF